MIGKLLILFVVLPLAELYLLLRFADATNIPTTISVVVLTGICGSILASRQGMVAMRNFQDAVAEGRVPGAEAIDGILIAFAAALLLTPGLLTDSLGLALLIPWSRVRFRRWLVNRFAGRFKVVTFQSGTPEDDPDGARTVDATFHHTDEKRKSLDSNREG
jgi:UPF0716 protein FxsA